jgi:phosphatidylglycerol---prolipoprotein diacylglyceryl transferase
VTTTYLAYIPSPAQGVWHLGPVPLRAYALFIIVGIVVALVLGDRRWVARGGQAGVIYDIALWAVPFGLIGGRLYHVITDWRTYFGDDGAGLAGALRIWDGGLGIWGAVALGGVGAWIGCRQKGIPLPAFGDAIAPGIILAQAIGRLGNYFNQELYGRPTTLPWGLEIYERRDAAGALDTLNGVSTGQLIEVVHPTFLYELLWNVLVFAALIYIDRRFKVGHGRLFAMYVAGYCLGRFWIELMRSDVATHIAGIRVNSFTSTFVFIGAVVYIMVAPKGREEPASLAGKPEKVAEEEDAVEAFAKELTAVAATTGVVAAAKAAGDVEDEDAKAAAEDAKEGKTDELEGSEAEEFAADIEEEPEEPEAQPEDGAGPEAGLGVLEGEEAVEALEAAPEVHEAEVEAAEEAEAVADEVAGEDEAVADEKTEKAEAQADQAEPETAEPEAGLGVVEGEEAVEALEAAPEVHEAEVEAAEKAEAVADEMAGEDEEPSSEAAAEAEALVEDVAAAPSEDIAMAEEFAAAGEEADAAESDDAEPDEPETEDAEAAVEEAGAEPSEEEAAKEAEAVVDEADIAAEEEPTTGVLEEVGPEAATAAKPEPPAKSGGRLSRWLRRNR